MRRGPESRGVALVDRGLDRRELRWTVVEECANNGGEQLFVAGMSARNLKLHRRRARPVGVAAGDGHDFRVSNQPAGFDVFAHDPAGAEDAEAQHARSLAGKSTGSQK